MFKILGGDGKEYGPVTTEQIKKWVAEGRANRETQVQQTGDSNWKPLDQFPEFADVLGVLPPVAAPRLATPGPSVSVAGSLDAGARIRAQQAVAGPAIGLMVTAGLGLAGGLFGLILTLVRSGNPPEMPGMDPQVTHFIQVFAYGPMGIITKIVGLAISLFVLFGAIKMQKLAGYGFAMAAAIIALIPCFSPCCLIGLPIGIWVLVVLSKPEVKSQFD
jgi:hypothetical protein